VRVIGVNSFGQGNGALAAPFFPNSGGATQLFVTSNNIAYCNPLNGDSCMYYNAFASARGSQWAEVVLNAPQATTGAGYGPAVCVSSATYSYYAIIGNQNGWELQRVSNGSLVVNQKTTPVFATGDLLMIQAAVDTPTGLMKVTALKNRKPFITVYDANNLQGQPGIAYSSTDAAGAGISAFTCGDMIQPWVADPAVRGSVNNYLSGAGTTLVTTVTLNVVEGDAIHVYTSVDFGGGINFSTMTVGDTSSNGYTLLGWIHDGRVQQAAAHWYCAYARGNPAMLFSFGTPGNNQHRTIIARALSNVNHYQPVDGANAEQWITQLSVVADSIAGGMANSYQPGLVSVFLGTENGAVRPAAGTGMTYDGNIGEGSGTVIAHQNVNTVGYLKAFFTPGSTGVGMEYESYAAHFGAPLRDPEASMIAKLQRRVGT
jgi:hypothetical protein